MADEQDQSQKTEEPTPRRLEEARKKGQIASSREVNHWFMILAAAVASIALMPMFLRDLLAALNRFVEQPDKIPVDANGLGSVLGDAIGDILLAFLPIVVLLVVAAFLSGVVQSGFLVSAERIQPKLEKISLIKGTKRLFSLKSIMEFVKGVGKLAIVAAVATMLLLPVFDEVQRMPQMSMAGMIDMLHGLVIRLLMGILAVMTVIAGIDFLYQRFEHIKSLRMSRQEIKDEMKQSEGDPQVKAKLRQIRTERARKRMMAAVPDADVIITNPTHFAVALVYDPSDMSAPRVVAKGADVLAQRIRSIAEEHDIPLVENPPLARALYDVVDVDAEIPPEHYKVVAEIISYVFRVKGKTMPA